MAKQKKMIRREHRKGAVRPKVTAAPVHRQPPARASVLLEPTDPERESDALDEVRADLAGVPGEGRGWHGSDDR